MPDAPLKRRPGIGSGHSEATFSSFLLSWTSRSCARQADRREGFAWVDKHPCGHPKLADSRIKSPAHEIGPAEPRPICLDRRVILFKRSLLSLIRGLVAEIGRAHV